MAVVAATLSTTTTARLVYDMATLADLFSILAFLVALSIYYVARQISLRSRKAREAALLEEDRRDREHATYLIRLCRQLVQGLSADTPSRPALSATTVPQIATMMGTISSHYGHLVSYEGRLATANIQDTVMEILGSGAFCSATNVSDLFSDLVILADSVLDLNDPLLAGRRERAADSVDPAPT